MGMLESLRSLWKVDPGRATWLARMHRADLPTDLLERVAARNAMVHAQAVRLREARSIDDRVNTGMAIVGGAMQAMMSTSFVPLGPDAEQQIFELVMGLAAMDLPPFPGQNAAHEDAMEACLRGTITGAEFFAAVVPAEHQAAVAGQLEIFTSLLASMGPSMQPMAKLMAALPRIGAALSLPEARLPGVFGSG